MSDQEPAREEMILKAVKVVLTNIVKDTATEPGIKHPLSDTTIIGIRDCFGMITQREQELAEESGREMNMRPHYTDEVKQSEVVIPLDMISGQKKQDKSK